MVTQSCWFQFLLVCLLPVLGFQSCTHSGSGKVLSIITWNVQNLSDAVHQGGEYPEFDPRNGSWNRRLYEARLQHLANSIATFGSSPPDILVLPEIENFAVLKDLLKQNRFPGDWKAVFWQGPPGGGMGFGVFSRLPVLRAKSHGLHDGTFRLRPLLELTLQAEHGPLTLFAGHWKSRLKNSAANDLARLLASDTVARHGKGKTWLLVGDLNEEAGRGSLGNTGEWTDLEPHYGAMASLLKAVEVPDESLLGNAGTYWYRGGWEHIDHCIRGGDWPPSRARVFLPQAPLLTNQEGRPLRYDSRTGRGSSDHLPFGMEITWMD